MNARTLLLVLLLPLAALLPLTIPAAPAAPCAVDPASGSVECTFPEPSDCLDCQVPARPLPGSNACRGNPTFSFSLSTGLGANGQGSAALTPDGIWHLASYPPLNAPGGALSVGVNPHPVTWVSDVGSSWINPSGDKWGAPLGDYVYEAPYVIPAGAQGVTLSGRYAADNEATLSDTDTFASTIIDVSPSTNAFSAWNPIPLTPLGVGPHTLTFWVRNLHDQSPVGLNAQIVVEGTCPPVRTTACQGAARTFTIPLNTGIDPAGTPLPPSVVDPYWQTTYTPSSVSSSGPAAPAYSHGIWPLWTWVYDPASAWINAHPTTVNDAVGDYGYQLLYFLPPNAYDVTVSGNVSADNDAILADTDSFISIFVAQTPSPYGYLQWTPFSYAVNSNGLHIFSAHVYNDGGPTGLNVVGAVKGKCARIIDTGTGVEEAVEHALG